MDERLEEMVANLMSIAEKIMGSENISRMGVGFGIKNGKEMPIIVNPIRNVVFVSNLNYHEKASQLVKEYNEIESGWNLEENYSS